MIASELKLAQMTRNMENHNRKTAYERSEINGYLNGYKRVPKTLHSASELVKIHRQEHGKALGTIIYKSHNIENTNLSSTFLSTLLLASIHIYYGERGGLVVNASDSGSRGRGFESHLGQTVLCP